MENNRLKALLKLLTTETPAHGAVLRQEIAAALKEDPLRVQTVLAEEFSGATPLPLLHTLEEIYWEELAHCFAGFVTKINPDLEEGLILLSRFQNPTISRTEITDTVDTVSRVLRPALLNANGPTEMARILSHYFFQTLHIKTLPANLNIESISFANFMQKKQGSGLCAACLYVLVGARYGLDINLIDLAGRILVYWQGTPSLFIDPLDNGKILSQDDCQAYLLARQLAWKEEFVVPLSSRQIVRRLMANMIFVLNKVRDERRLSYLRKYLEIMKN